jgi:hypothetical protein
MENRDLENPMLRCVMDNPSKGRLVVTLQFLILRLATDEHAADLCVASRFFSVTVFSSSAFYQNITFLNTTVMSVYEARYFLYYV